jgi:hypothetical protein
MNELFRLAMPHSDRVDIVESPLLVEEREILPLLTLLDDPDERIAQPVLARLRSYGPSVIDSLLAFEDYTFDPLAKARSQALVRELNEEVLANEFIR